ncbi:unnamed protein product [Parascedosporium putredinis]|nr:unnamed protein product [Parascedosporium putredinis]CAI7997041.1 unnamed protein product [Parascedosporium putredinis]
MANQFINCSYHEIFTQEPRAPDGVQMLMWDGWKAYFSPYPEAAIARLYGPESPLDFTFQIGDEPAPSFMPILEESLAPLMDYMCPSKGVTALPALYEWIDIASGDFHLDRVRPHGAQDVAEQQISHVQLQLAYASRSTMLGPREPIITTFVLQKSSFDRNSALTITAMELLQPTAAPLISAAAGWYISRGEGFQVLVTDAVITILGLLVALPQLALVSAINPSLLTTNFGLVPLGLLLALGPWALAYAIGGVFSLTFQLFFILAIIFRSGQLAEIASISLIILLALVTFVVLTPIWAIWELIWKIRHQRRQREPEWQLNKEQKELERKEMFPLSRYFTRKFYSTKRWKRWLTIFIFWFFATLSFVSFVGKWMVMVNLLGAAGDAYCPSNFVQATFAGLGFKFGVLAIGLAMQYFGLTA